MKTVLVIRADAAPDSLMRIVMQLALCNVPPHTLRSRVLSGEELLVVAAWRRLSIDLADRMVRKLQQLTCVEQVELRSGGEAPTRPIYEGLVR